MIAFQYTMGTTKTAAMRPATMTHLDRRYFLSEGMRKETRQRRAPTKKNIVSLVSSPTPTTSPAHTQSLGSLRFTSLMTTYERTDHQSWSKASGANSDPSARRVSTKMVETAVEDLGPPPASQLPCNHPRDEDD